MAVRVVINHRTEYRYDRPVLLQPQVLRLRPAAHCAATILAYSLRIEPTDHFSHRQMDPYSNHLARIVVPNKTTHFCIEVDLALELQPVNPFDFFLEPSAVHWPFTYEPRLARDLQLYLEPSEYGPELQEWLLAIDRGQRPTIEFLVEQNQRVHRAVSYVRRDEPGVQTSEVTLSLGTGSCRDNAWLLLQVLRHLGVAARFVSGYSIQLTPYEDRPDELGEPVPDRTDLHAWVEAYLPGAGWIGLDPGSGLLAGEGHIPLACAPEPEGAAPVSGAVESCAPTLHYHTTLQRIEEAVSVACPYGVAEWQAILAQGQAVDAALNAADVRLALTRTLRLIPEVNAESAASDSVPRDTPPGDRASKLLARLRERSAEGGLVVCNEDNSGPVAASIGPGSIYSRVDGEPIWRNAELLADPSLPGEWCSADANRFMRALTTTLGLEANAAVPGFADRASTADQHNEIADPIGYALPLTRHADGHWCSSRWQIPGERLVLLPGGAAMGWRLPPDLVPQDMPAGDSTEPTSDPLLQGLALPSYAALSSRLPKSRGLQDEVARPIRTALCLEIRQGQMYVFLPALHDLQAFLELVAAIELVAAAVGIAVLFEGHGVPEDRRLRQLRMRTDEHDGLVIELPRSGCWAETLAELAALYDEAHGCGLTTTPIMDAGYEQAPCAALRIGLSGLTTDASPIVRRPDLLRSLLGYWHHHPSLSYLFAGPSIGPDSSTPRVDELRDSALHELQIALQKLPDDVEPRAVLVDTWLQNLQPVLQRKFQRAEFAIEAVEGSNTSKMQVVLRGFAMPPHARMLAVQELLLRSLIGMFWRQPCPARLVPWGTELHDRFMLPYFIWQDFRQVLQDLRESGYGLELDWFKVFYEFRFPLVGRMEIDHGELELRCALEPWRVLQGSGLAEAVSTPAVDTSMQRLQVLTRGLTESRHVVICNGRRVPLRRTAMRGVAVAGVRYKARHAPVSLHPNVPVHTPLLFEVIDTVRARAVAGCTYQVSGSSLDENVASLQQHATAPTPRQAPPEESHGEYPYTLDLRYLPV
jgi:uncharacterized protein (DUF2126 family)/transglutaminase-like putative cysteine protease